MAFMCNNDDEETTLHEGDIVIWQSDGWDDIMSILLDHAEKYLPDEGPWDAEKILADLREYSY